MGAIKLFRVHEGKAEELPGRSVALEKSLQTLIEQNLETLLGVRFLASEFATGPRHRGRIDTLGLDENNCPVIIEYKRALNENVINQGLFYLDWLMDHRADFKLLVLNRLGEAAAEAIDWSAPRLICIAGDFTKFDEHAVQQMGRNIELVRYRHYDTPEGGLLLLELVNAPASNPVVVATQKGASASAVPPVVQAIQALPESLQDLFEQVRQFNLALGDDVQEQTQKYYIAYKRIRNFCCLQALPKFQLLRLYLNVDPDKVELVEGFTEDVRRIGHDGTGDLRVLLRNADNLERAKELIIRSYEAS